MGDANRERERREGREGVGFEHREENVRGVGTDWRNVWLGMRSEFPLPIVQEAQRLTLPTGTNDRAAIADVRPVAGSLNLEANASQVARRPPIAQPATRTPDAPMGRPRNGPPLIRTPAATNMRRVSHEEPPRLSVDDSKHVKHVEAAMRRIEKDLTDVTKNGPDGFFACPLSSDDSELHFWNVVIEGPVGSPYEGGVFFLDIIFPLGQKRMYPFFPPELYFRSRIYHCNVDLDGKVQLPILRKWSPTCTVFRVFDTLRRLLIEPNAQDPLMHSLAAEYEEDRNSYLQKAAEWTHRFAM